MLVFLYRTGNIETNNKKLFFRNLLEDFVRVVLYSSARNFQHPLFPNGRRIELAGRDSDCDIKLDGEAVGDDSKGISKHHAVIANVGTDEKPDIHIKDLGSRNGTWATVEEDKEIDLRKLPGRESQINLGQLFRFGRVKFVIIEADKIPSGAGGDHTEMIEPPK